ncbi:hypothetical protein, partial [Serratia ficaria]
MKLKIKVLSLLTVSSFLLLDKASATNFDTSLLAGTSRESDLSRFYTQVTSRCRMSSTQTSYPDCCLGFMLLQLEV